MIKLVTFSVSFYQMFYTKFLFNAKYVVLLQKSSIKKLPKFFLQNLQENICLYRPVNVEIPPGDCFFRALFCVLVVVMLLRMH